MPTTRLFTVALTLGLFLPMYGQKPKVIYSFDFRTGPACPGDPGTISQSPGGNLISSADNHCTGGNGGAYEISPRGKFTLLQQASYKDFSGLIAPGGGLTLGTDQRFHGVDSLGGSSFNSGRVFRISPKPGSRIVFEHDFTGGDDGAKPGAAPIQGLSGAWYGTTRGDGNTNFGTVYRITDSGEYSVLHDFSGPDGDSPVGALVQGRDSNFYGTTLGGGTFGKGTIFRISAAGDFKVLYNFDGTHGDTPDGPLIQASDGNFYGLTENGGTDFDGVAFKITPDGTLTVLHDFTGGPDGAFPAGGLIQATDGNFYGTTNAGGKEDWGQIFRITSTGAFTDLWDFDFTTGANSRSTLLQHTNGKIYGQTRVGGYTGSGVMFELDLGLPPFVTFLNVYGRVGANVVILGQGFTSASVVSFNGKPAQNPEIHPTYIKAVVPAGATSGPITVTTSKGTLTSNKPFVVH